MDLQAAKGWTALMIATLKGRDNVIGVLLEKGADANIRDMQGFTPLMRAVAEKRAATVRRLLDFEGVEVDASDERGIAAIHLSAASGQLEIARMLLDRGAEADSRDKAGNTPISLAEDAGHASVAALLKARSGTAH